MMMAFCGDGAMSLVIFLDPEASMKGQKSWSILDNYNFKLTGPTNER